MISFYQYQSSCWNQGVINLIDNRVKLSSRLLNSSSISQLGTDWPRRSSRELFPSHTPQARGHRDRFPGTPGTSPTSSELCLTVLSLRPRWRDWQDVGRHLPSPRQQRKSLYFTLANCAVTALGLFTLPAQQIESKLTYLATMGLWWTGD